MISILRSRSKCLAVLLVLALAPATASAAAKSKKKRASTPAAKSTPAPETAPAPALEPAPAPEPAPARSTHAMSSPAPKVFSNSPALGAGIGALDFAGLLALDIPTESAASIGPRITGELMYNVMDLAPQLRLAVGARGSFAYHSFDPNGSFWLLEGVPDAKIKFALNDMFAVYGDLGMGLSFQHLSVDVGAFSASDNTLSFTVQFGAGAAYAITPNLNLLGEVRFNLYTRSGGTHTIAVPTVGVQYHP